jgi:hypothetical protein
MLKIQGVTMPEPSSLTWGLSDESSEESGRTLDGIMHKDIIASKVKLDCAWNNVSGSDASTILQAVCPYAFRSITYIDPLTNSQVTKTFYTGDKSAPVKSYAVNGVTYSSVYFNFIEQ